jgi:hypothetical protein
MHHQADQPFNRTTKERCFVVHSALRVTAVG